MPKKIIKNKLLGKAMNKIQFEMSRIVEEIIMKMSVLGSSHNDEVLIDIKNDADRFVNSGMNYQFFVLKSNPLTLVSK